MAEIIANIDNRFNKEFWFIVGLCLFVAGYATAITFIPIPKENIRFADTCLGFFLGTGFASAIGYILNGNRTKAIKSPVPVVIKQVTDNENK